MREDKDFYVEWFSGTGKGGQHRNKHANSAKVYHLPTGLIESRQGRSRTNNLNDAKNALIEKLDGEKHNEIYSEISSTVKNQVGSGMRGDKIRTYRFQDDIVVDHLTGKKTSTKKIMKGNFKLLW